MAASTKHPHTPSTKHKESRSHARSTTVLGKSEQGFTLEPLPSNEFMIGRPHRPGAHGESQDLSAVVAICLNRNMLRSAGFSKKG